MSDKQLISDYSNLVCKQQKEYTTRGNTQQSQELFVCIQTICDKLKSRGYKQIFTSGKFVWRKA